MNKKTTIIVLVVFAVWFAALVWLLVIALLEPASDVFKERCELSGGEWMQYGGCLYESNFSTTTMTLKD